MIKQIALLLLVATGCQVAPVQKEAPVRITTSGQKILKKGMSQGDVALLFGTPNIATVNALGKEAWVYDRTAKEVQNEDDKWLITTDIKLPSQHTLTLLVTFDDARHVADVTYHRNQF